MQRRSAFELALSRRYDVPTMRSSKLVLLATLILLPTAFVLAQRPAYPPTLKGDVVDDYFGTKVADPYRWMEDLDSKAVADWIAAQNTLSFGYLEKLPMREHFKNRITKFWDYQKTGLQTVESGHLFYAQNSGIQLQSPLFMRKGEA